MYPFRLLPNEYWRDGAAKPECQRSNLLNETGGEAERTRISAFASSFTATLSLVQWVVLFASFYCNYRAYHRRHNSKNIRLLSGFYLNCNVSSLTRVAGANLSPSLPCIPSGSSLLRKEDRRLANESGHRRTVRTHTGSRYASQPTSIRSHVNRHSFKASMYFPREAKNELKRI